MGERSQSTPDLLEAEGSSSGIETGTGAGSQGSQGSWSRKKAVTEAPGQFQGSLQASRGAEAYMGALTTGRVSAATIFT